MSESSIARIGDDLVARGLITKAQLQHALEEQKRNPELIGRILVRLGYVAEHDLLTVLVERLRLPFIQLKTAVIDPEAIKQIPVKIAVHYGVIPIWLKGRTVTVCTSDPLDIDMKDDVRLITQGEVEFAIGLESEIREAIKKHYGISQEDFEKLSKPATEEQEHAQVTVKQVHTKGDELDFTVSHFVNELVLEAWLQRATDIHIEPYEKELRIRYRVDGMLQDIKQMPQDMQFQAAIVSRIKIMANLDIAEHRLPQDGQIKVMLQSGELDLRVSVIPTSHGETVVIRILSVDQLSSLENLGFSDRHIKSLIEILKKPHGIIFATGPTGCGKSTTLCACLRHINHTERKIITIEDPIEYRLSGVTQIQVKPDIGFTFSQGLRAMLRHDPDVMMVGEVRDRETAEMTIRTALTGHLVFSTLHTNDACGAIGRLIDMGIEPFLISSSLECIIAQRLIRVLCPKCSQNQEASTLKAVKIGCGVCHGSGFMGRTAINEMLVMDDDLRNLVLKRASSHEIRDLAVKKGMTTLRDDGLEKVSRGITTLEEVLRVTQDDQTVFNPITKSA
jgi:type II secretory ATPase GspE/PulE/Tfp pilus assembly ATPase PilB-like protein